MTTPAAPVLPSLQEQARRKFKAGGGDRAIVETAGRSILATVVTIDGATFAFTGGYTIPSPTVLQWL